MLGIIKRFVIVLLSVGLVIGQAPLEKVQDALRSYEYEHDNPHLAVVIRILLAFSFEIVLLGYMAGQRIVPFNVAASFILLILGLFGKELFSGLYVLHYGLKKLLRRGKR